MKAPQVKEAALLIDELALLETLQEIGSLVSEIKLDVLCRARPDAPESEYVSGVINRVVKYRRESLEDDLRDNIKKAVSEVKLKLRDLGVEL
jgi:hypothetical protein